MTDNSYLSHYGIQGQKWGVRRFQNEDGTYTEEGKNRYRQVPEGKTRYGRGKTVSKEMQAMQNKARKKLEAEDEEKERNIRDKLDRVIRDYGLDGDDGGGGNTRLYSERELHYAKKRFWELSDKLYEMDEARKDKAIKAARKQIIDKYGEVALSDMKHYQNVNATVSAAALLSALGGLMYLSLK